MIPQKVYDLCHSTNPVSSELARDPTLAPGDVRKKLYGDFEKGVTKPKNFRESNTSAEDLQRALECGKWGPTRPSDLFLTIYHDVLLTIESDPICGMVSPPLLGSCGVVPLTIIAPLLDICRHMSNCIARAEKEVFLATNYWKHSEATILITNSLKELSRRAGARGSKVVVKIMYDRGSAKQVINNHQLVPESEYTVGDVKMPSHTEIPHIDLEVMNYHRPVFGTFHSKFMVVDRELALLSSNNIQENDNVEMMVRLEGPIVDSFYDMSLISWHNAMKHHLPMLKSPAAGRDLPSFRAPSHSSMFDENGGLRNLTSLVRMGNRETLPAHTADNPHYDPDIASEALRSQSVLSQRNGESRMQAVTRHLNITKDKDIKGDAPECDEGDEMTTFIPLPTHDLVPMAMNAAFLSAMRNATQSVFIQTPNLNAEPLIPAILETVRRKVDVFYYVCLGYNDAGELLPGQNGTNEMIAHRLYTSLKEDEKQYLHVYNYVAKDQTRPIHNKFKKRSCHIKLMIVDERIGIQGNGNQDTQSWFHSQEINVMIDSAAVCAAWLEGIRRNQNTHIYGAVRKDDGCWHDREGKQAEGATGIDPGRFSWAKGIIGAVQRARGAGGF